MNNMCNELHQIFNGLEEYLCSEINRKEIPKNGVYVFFEKGETFNGLKRIVQVGAHRGDNKLQSRLQEHLVKEKKDRSILRKNIGLALLNAESNRFIDHWNLNLTSKANKEKYAKQINFEKQASIEKRVSKYIHENISFAVFEVVENEQRLRLESKIISTLSMATNCKPSGNWLGLSLPSFKQELKNSGLWLESDVNKEPLSEDELAEIKKIIQRTNGN